MIDRILRILAINPVLLFIRSLCLTMRNADLRRVSAISSDELHACGSIIGQKDMRSGHIARALKENGVGPVYSCGGGPLRSVKPIELVPTPLTAR